MKKKKRIMIGVDHKWRDLAGYAYLKWLLEEFYDCEVRLFREGCESRLMFAWKPDVLVLNHLLSIKRARWLAGIHRHGLKIALLPTEGIPTLKFSMPVQVGKFTDLSMVDLQFVWAPRMKKAFLDAGTVPEEKLKVIGVPRFDFYHSNLQLLVSARDDILKKYQLDPSKRTLLWTTNFTHAGMFQKRETFLIKDWNNLGLMQVKEFSDPVAYARREYECRALAMKFLDKLVRNFPDINIMLKPHPSEEHTFYFQIEEKLKTDAPGRFAVIYKEYIWDVLHAADILLERSCTTGVEAWLLGKPTIEMKLFSGGFYFSEEHAKGSIIVEDETAALDSIRDLLRGESLSQDIHAHREQFIRDWCYRNDGQRTIECAQHLAQLAGVSDGFYFPWMSLRYYKTALESWAAHLLKKQEYEPLVSKAQPRQDKIDKLGRIDKWVQQEDILSWNGKIQRISERLFPLVKPLVDFYRSGSTPT